MVNLKNEYIVIADGFIKRRGTFRECQKWCREMSWLYEVFKEILIVKVVANGKEV